MFRSVDIIKTIKLLKEENNTLKSKIQLSKTIIEDLEDQRLNITLKSLQELKKKNEKLNAQNTKLQKTEKELSIKNDHLEKAIENKNLLMKEIHHRVKNNLQLLSSLLSIQKRNNKVYDNSELIIGITNRITAISSLHQMLYQNFGSELINLEEYLNKTFKPIINSEAELVIDGPSFMISIEACTYLGLILNELITNSLKHGWKTGNFKEKIIRISFHTPPPHFSLHYSDNGNGLIDTSSKEGFGKSIISLLITKQMTGKYKEYSKEGYNMEIEIPEKELSN